MIGANSGHEVLVMWHHPHSLFALSREKLPVIGQVVTATI